MCVVDAPVQPIVQKGSYGPQIMYLFISVVKEVDYCSEGSEFKSQNCKDATVGSLSKTLILNTLFKCKSLRIRESLKNALKCKIHCHMVSCLHLGSSDI